MKNVLFCVDSYFQLLVSINLRLDVYADWNADIIVYDSTGGARQICENLRAEKLFRTVYFAATTLTRTGARYTFMEKLPKYFVYLYTIISPQKYSEKCLNAPFIEKYDHFLFNGYGALPDCLFNACNNRNPQIRCYRIDDGVGTYVAEWGKYKSAIRTILERILYFLFRRQHMENYVDGYYVSEPDLIAYPISYPVLRLPKFHQNDPAYVAMINRIFGYRPTDDFCGKRVIYFSTAGFKKDLFDRDITFLKQLKAHIPAHLITIKTHPRENTEKYEEIGIDISKNGSVPWEVVMLNHNFSNVIFMTQISSAVFSAKLYFPRDGYDFYVYKCTWRSADTSRKALEKLIQRYAKKFGNSVCIPETMEELISQIKSLISISSKADE